MIRNAGPIALLLLVPALSAHADIVTLRFSGTIEAVIDAASPGAPDIDFTPIPIGSSFQGTYSYDSESPPTDGGTGYLRYLDLLSSGGSVTVNGFQFSSIDAGAAVVVSEEAGFSYSGVAISTQPISLPTGWSVANTASPYFTIRFEDAFLQTRSLALPSSAADFPVDNMVFVLDFLQSVNVDGQEYGQRVYIVGRITSLEVRGVIPPPREVGIDLDPSSVDNKVNLNSRNPKPLDVAVFGASDFDVFAVVPETIGLGDPVLTDPETGTGTKAPPTIIDYADVDGDGELDLLLTFDLLTLQDFGAIDSLSTLMEFQALLDNQGIVFGSDAISTQRGRGKK